MEGRAKMTDLQPLNIVCAGRIEDTEPLITLIKSLCYHHENPIHVYLFNKDIAGEWFSSLNYHLRKLNSEIFDIKLNIQHFEVVQNAGEREIDFYRFAVPALQELERALYLDINMVIDAPITDFYFQDFEEKMIVAVPDFYYNTPRLNYLSAGELEIKPYFNMGVILFNNTLCKQQRFTSHLFAQAQRYSDIEQPVQDNLNITLQDYWKVAPKKYNYQIGVMNNKVLHEIEKHEVLDLQGEKPVIIQYAKDAMPYQMQGEKMPLARQYWFYYRLTWDEIAKKRYFKT